jgi:hypothetical protein
MIADPHRFPTWGHPQSEWDAAKREATGVMSSVASRRGTIAYSDLTPLIRSISFAPDEKPFHNLLGQVSIEEDRAGRGMLSAVVIHKTGNKRPGAGFFELAQELGRDVHDHERFWSEELQRVHRVWTR